MYVCDNSDGVFRGMLGVLPEGQALVPDQVGVPFLGHTNELSLVCLHVNHVLLGQIDRCSAIFRSRFAERRFAISRGCRSSICSACLFFGCLFIVLRFVLSLFVICRGGLSFVVRLARLWT